MFKGNRNARLGQNGAIFHYGCNGGRSTHRVGVLGDGRAHYILQ